MKSPFRSISVLFLLICLPLASFAGHVFVLEVTEVGKDPQQMEIAVQDGNLKMQLPASPEAPRGGSMIYAGDTDTLFLVDAARRSYVQLDTDRIAAITAALEQQLAAMPPQQQAMMRQMMGGSFTMPSVTIEESGEKKKIDGIAARLVRILVDGEKKSEDWVAGYSEVSGSEELATTMSKMGDLFIKFLEAMPMAAEQGLDAAMMLKQLEELKGFPVQSKSYEDGELKDSTRLIEVRKEPVSGFAPPEGFKEQMIGGR